MKQANAATPSSPMAGQAIAEVVVEVPAKNVDRRFDYLIPEQLNEQVQLGSRVIVPFGSRKIQGYVLLIKKESAQQQKLKEIEAVPDPFPPLTAELIHLGEWMSKEYVSLLITALQALLPSVLKGKVSKRVHQQNGQQEVEYIVSDQITYKKVAYVESLLAREELTATLEKTSNRAKKQRQILQYLIDHPEEIAQQELLQACQTTRAALQPLIEKQIVRMIEREAFRDPYQHRTFEQTSPLPLTEEQNKVYQRIIDTVEQRQHDTFLLHGVTGSGKTEIYLQSISYVLEQGKEAIVLVPEISLTPQMVERFKGRFGNQVAVIHSRLSAGERFDEWRKIHTGEVNVVIGARSALFAPFRNLGLIIIDEEHESSYKQEESPKYHARDVAIFRGQHHQIPVILGSATPSLESYARAQKGVYKLLPLGERVQGRAMPSVEVVDMRQELFQGNRSMFSRSLYAQIEERLQKQEQMVLFLNRRGFSTFVMCRECGYVLHCPHCDISLTYHKHNQTHRCHYCGYTEKLCQECPECSSPHIRFFGTGTQKVEEELHKHFPGISVIRMDIDTTQKKGSHERLLQAFKQGKANCLLGTQMIAKGLDFENVTLVGVITADSLLHLPDFRASEKTFQLLTQVSGRAGRHHLPGEVVIQTYTPEHYSIEAAADHNYEQFYKQEMVHRRQRGYPPYFYISMITFSHEDLLYLVKACQESVAWLKKRVSPNTVVLGPVASSIPKIKDRYRYQCMVKYRDEPQLSAIMHDLLQVLQAKMDKSGLQVQIDVRP